MLTTGTGACLYGGLPGGQQGLVVGVAGARKEVTCCCRLML